MSVVSGRSVSGKVPAARARRRSRITRCSLKEPSSWAERRSGSYTATVIYCVIPRELEAELFEKMVEYYKDNPNVTVIVDRRVGPDRRSGQEDGSFKEQRIIRDRRRARAAGTFPDTDVPDTTDK